MHTLRMIRFAALYYCRAWKDAQDVCACSTRDDFTVRNIDEHGGYHLTLLHQRLRCKTP